MILVHAHCDVIVDTEPWVQDLMAVIKRPHDITEFLAARKQLEERNKRWQRWLIEHGYQAGRDYWPCKEGYRFSNDSLAFAFMLGAQ